VKWIDEVLQVALRTCRRRFAGRFRASRSNDKPRARRVAKRASKQVRGTELEIKRMATNVAIRSALLLL
jgi:hypothetical protein